MRTDFLPVEILDEQVTDDPLHCHLRDAFNKRDFGSDDEWVSGERFVRHKDAKGYYAVFGLPPSATAAEIKQAFRRLAKEAHPDTGQLNDAGARFRVINEAYSVLGSTEKRATYDSFSATASQSTASPTEIEPIRCGSCGQVAAQPRYIVFRHVVSVIFVTFRTPVQGIYCSECARKASLKATMISAVAGWWGVPWGPIFTVWEVLRNAFGGDSNVENEEHLLWHNTLAFTSRGETQLAHGLAARLRSSANPKIAKGAGGLIDHFRSAGIGPTRTLKNPWRIRPHVVLPHILMVAIAPIVVVILLQEVDAQGTQTWQASEAASLYSPPPDVAPVSTSEPPTETPALVDPVPTCGRMPGNGEKLSGGLVVTQDGHLIEIENGSGGPAIVKVRDAASRELVTSFFVSKNRTAGVEGIPDGNYIIQYAFGPSLAEDCRSFTTISAAGQFPGVETFVTQRHEDELGIQIERMRLRYTLYAVPGGTIRPQSLDSAAFNAD